MSAYKKEIIYNLESTHGEITLLKYTEKCAVICGSATYGVRTELKKLDGKFNKHLKCGPGWIFPIGMTDVLTHFLKEIEEKENSAKDWSRPVGKVNSCTIGLKPKRKSGDKFICRRKNCEELTDNNCGFCKKHHSTYYHDHEKKICIHYFGSLLMFKNTKGDLYFKNARK